MAEYIMSAKACAYVLGGPTNTAALFDFDGVYVLDGGFAEKNTGFLAHVRNISAVLLAAPTKNNLGTSGALLEQLFQQRPMPVYMNTKPLKAVKPGSSGEQAKEIQEANSKLLCVEPIVFSPKYQPYILYRSAEKGIVSLYILAGDAKDAEIITKALASGNEAEVEKAAAEHGTIGILLWRPARVDKPAVRVLISGTSSLARIQQSLDKAAKALPFLNAPVVNSKDALTDIPAPSSGPSAKTATGKPLARPTPPSSGPRPAAAAPGRVPLRSGPPSAAPARSATSTTVKAPTARAAPAPKAPITKATAPVARARPASATTATAPVKKPAAPAVRTTASARSSETVAVKKTVGKVQGAAPSKPAPGAPAAKKASAPVSAASKPAAPVKKPSPPPAVAQVVPTIAAPAPEVVVNLDDSVICLSDMNQGSSGEPDIVIIPPTPEPPRHEEEAKEAVKPKEEPQDSVGNIVGDVEPEIPPPVDAFKKPDPQPAEDPKPEEKPVVPVYPNLDDIVPAVTPSLIDVDPSSPVAPAAPVEPTLIDTDPVAPVTPAAPAEPTLIDTDPIAPSHPEPSAPLVPADHVIISQDDPALPDIAAAVPFVPHVKPEDDGLITLDDDDKVHVAPGFEEPLVPQAPREDGTLADCSEEVSKLVEISMDTDKSNAEADTTKPVGEVTQLASDFKGLELDDKTDEYVRKISSQMIEEATLPFMSALANTIVSMDSSASNGSNGTTEEKPLVDFDNTITNGQQQQQEGQKEASKHDLMQSRSSVIENGAPVQYETADPALDGVLAECAHESEKVDASVAAAHSETLHMPERPGVVAAAKPVKFARPYYFDVVTLPRNEKVELTVNADGITEFVSKIRSRNLILPSRGISSEQLGAILTGKQTWCDSAHPCHVIPTNSTPELSDFRQKNEEQFATNFLTLAHPVDKQRTTVTADAGEIEYELARFEL